MLNVTAERTFSESAHHCQASGRVTSLAVLGVNTAWAGRQYGVDRRCFSTACAPIPGSLHEQNLFLCTHKYYISGLASEHATKQYL